MKVSQQDVYLGAHLGSVSTEGRGRKLDGPEGEAELQCTPTWASANSTGKFEATVALQSCPNGTRKLGLYPTVLVRGYGPPLEGGETQDQVVFFR